MLAVRQEIHVTRLQICQHLVLRVHMLQQILIIVSLLHLVIFSNPASFLGYKATAAQDGVELCDSSTPPYTPSSTPYSDMFESVACQVCPAGYACDGTTIQLCPAGQYSADGDNSCTPCFPSFICPDKTSKVACGTAADGDK